MVSKGPCCEEGYNMVKMASGSQNSANGLVNEIRPYKRAPAGR